MERGNVKESALPPTLNMPATEKTWRDQLRMHVIFGVTSLVMLLATIWMLWKDHNREWRRWQLADRERAHWTIEAQLAQSHAESQSQSNRLTEELDKVRREKIDPNLIAQFQQTVRNEDDRLTKAGIQEKRADFSRFDAANEALQVAAADSKEAARARADLFKAMNSFVQEAKRRELEVTSKRKFMAADLNAVVSARGIAVGEGRATEELEANIQSLNSQLADLDIVLVASKEYRKSLEAIVTAMQAEENDLQKQVAAIDAEIKRFEDQLDKNRVGFFAGDKGIWRVVPNMEPVARWPILDAFNTGTIKLDQIWLPDMKISYNFSSVARYDRCINCHRAIDKTAPGSAVEPAYPAIPRDQRARTFELATPATKPESNLLEKVYGIRLADRGQVAPDDVTIQVVIPESLAAKAGLEMGDVFTTINGGPIHSASDVEHYLFEIADWGKPQAIEVRRGLDQPFTSHPRLDLYVGSTSPHKRGEMGCTICHDGQGSATDFKWASHTPNDPNQGRDWSLNYGWFENHHWSFPMTPARFIESNCLKCHHEVVELEPSQRFPEPPAPKLVAGYELVRQYGCYGCHEIGGFDGPTKRIGPDLRLEPNYYEVAAQILQDGGLNEAERGWATTLVSQSDDKAARDQLMRAIRQDAALANASRSAEGADTAARPRLSKETHANADALKDVEVPGRFRKVGPSLRHLASKVDFDWLYRWIRHPADFRPTTRMPQFFGNFDHLEKDLKEFKLRDANGEPQDVSDREYTERFENIEIRALTEFLMARSQPFEYLQQPANITEPPSAERGRWLFETRGCLACHSHAEFPGIASNQGPDLSRIAAKFGNERGQRWLYSWLKQPNHYHSRTIMPNVFLEPIGETDAAGALTGRVTDPAADIMTFLLGVPAQWQSEVPTVERGLTAQEAQDLEDLTAVWLTPSFQSKRLAARYAREGIPERIAGTVKVDELVLVGTLTDQNRVERQLEYVARRSISRYGCFGCHEIPGFEGAKPIGTPLASWGRKETSQLAFENIAQFLATHGIDGKQPANAGHGESAGHELDPQKVDGDTGYFLQALLGHQRNGFLWQKLRMPRAYDYQTTVNKRYDERLRMPKFPFTAEQREQVMTFVLGLTNEAPDAKYIYKPDRRQTAIIEGRHVLEKYNCAGCHILDMERWSVAFDPKLFDQPETTKDYPFVRPVVTAEEIKESLQPDRRGLLHAQLYGMPVRDEATGTVRIVDQDSVPLEAEDKSSPPFFQFTLYQQAVVSGAPRVVGGPNLLIPADRDRRGPANGVAYAGLGGDLAKYLYPRVIAEEKKVNPAVVPSEAWGWLPPPLHHEGVKVQTDWLHDFLMDPIELRPATVLRMPNFHMSSEEASKLVNYFAAESGAEFPYEYNSRRRSSQLAQLEDMHPKLFDDAMKIVTDSSFCVKCHSIGDYEVKGAVKTLGPRLDQVYRRLRPEYLRDWVAMPQRILPYTGMPLNIPYDPELPHQGGVGQQLFPGTSTQQLDGVVELLTNFDEYTKRHTGVKALVKEPTTAPGGGTAPPARGGAARGSQ
jgi:cytochrome c551/c552